MEYKKVRDLDLSYITCGLMRFNEEYTYEAFEKFILSCIAKGISTFDTADIYQVGKNEVFFGQFIEKHPDLRETIQIITKCGIVFPEFKEGVTIGRLEHTFEHIVNSAKNSIEKLNTTYIDLLLIHRPSPISDYNEIARALAYLKNEGLAREVGVSNFYPAHCDALQDSLDYYGHKIAANQIEINTFTLEHFKNFNFEYMKIHNIIPMAWSPLGGLFNHLQNDENKEIIEELQRIATKFNTDIITIMYAWILKHPSRPIIVSGTTKLHNIDIAIESLNFELDDNSWFEIYVKIQGYPMP